MDTTLIDTPLSAEDRLGPPVVSALSIGMMLFAGLIAGFIVGAIIFIGLYLFAGSVSLSTGSSPVILSLITLFSLVIGQSILYFIASLVFPEIYTQSRTAMSQIMLFELLLGACFMPIYHFIAGDSVKMILIVFSTHILLSTFAFYLILGLVSHYRYSLLSVYASFMGLILSGVIWAIAILPLDPSTQAIAILIGLVILSFVGTTFCVYLTLFLYSSSYRSTGRDPLGNVFRSIEEDEKRVEKATEAQLTQF